MTSDTAHLQEILARLKALEDEVGITERNEKRETLKQLKDLYIRYGFTGARAKGCAWRDFQCGNRIEDVEGHLIRRGAVLIERDDNEAV